jgi:hypothetical protein
MDRRLTMKEVALAVIDPKQAEQFLS